MKTTGFIIFFIIAILNSYGQNTFELIISNPIDEQPRDGLQLDNGDFIFPLAARDDYYSNYYTRIIKISSSGQVVNEIQIDNQNSDCFIYNTLQIGPNSFVGIGEWKETFNDSWLWYIGFDSTLAIIWDKKYDIPHNWMTFIRSFINISGNIVSAASLADYPNISPSELLLMEVTSSGDSIREALNDSGNPILFDIFEINSEYRAIAHGYSPYSSAQVLELDYNFNLLSIDSVPHHIGNCITAIKKDETSYYITGNNMMHTWDWVCTMLLDLNNDIILAKCIGNYDTVDYAGFDKSMSIFSADTLYLGITHNFDPSNGYYSSIDSWYGLSSLDSLLNLRWTKYYGNAGYNVLRSVMATSDGGVILSGNRYNDNFPDNKLDPYFVKVNSEGLITGISVKNDIQVHNALIYPNPGNDVLIVESGSQISGYEFILSDINGKTLIHHRIDQQRMQFVTSNLPAGLYAWRIIGKHTIIDSGRWIIIR